MAAIVGNTSRCGVTIEARHRNQPNKTKLVLCKASIHSNSYLKQLHITNKTERCSYKGNTWASTYQNI